MCFFFWQAFFSLFQYFWGISKIGEYPIFTSEQNFGEYPRLVHYFCSLFQSAFPFEFGAVSPEQSNQIPLQVVLREEKKKQMRSAEDATGG